MFELIFTNYLLLINLAIPFVIGLFLVLTNSKYTPKEFGIQMGLTMSILILAFVIGYSASNIFTNSYLTTKVDKFVYEESWTELVTYTESYPCGKSTCYRTKTRHDYHPDSYYYKIGNSFWNYSINKSEYNLSKNDFGETLTKRKHSNQISYGDGKIYEVIPNKEVVHSFTTNELNYIFASKRNIIKSYEYKDLETMYKNEIVEYPKFYSDVYGNDNFKRVINSHLISNDIKEKLQRELELFSINLNANPIVYLTTSKNREFASIIKGHFKDQYFYDAMIVIGVENDQILWIEPISLSKSVEFKVYGRDFTNNFDDLVEKYKDVFKKYWIKPNLEDYKYLISDIDLPLWYEISIVLLNIIGSFFIFRYMFKHDL